MKIHLKFNHKTKHLLQALDSPYEPEEVNEQLNDIIRNFMENEEYDAKSHLAELMHNGLDYSSILYIATKHVAGELETRAMKMALKRYLNDEDEII